MRLFYRKIILSSVFMLTAGFLSSAQTLPARPQGYVSDFTRALNLASQRRLESICAQLDQKTGVQIAVVTVASVKPYTIEQYAVKLFQDWGIGRKGKDEGILFLTALKDREVRIEVGYGLEGVVTDATSKTIIERAVLPFFRQEAYAEGIESGVSAIVGLIAKEKGITISGNKRALHQTGYPEREGGFNIFSLIFLIIFVILFIKNPRLFLFLMMMGMMGGGRRGSGYGGGFGGGFGGFGGGISGGGGASGRW